MFGRNIDFVAMAIIALGLLAFSKLPAVAMPPAPQPIRFHTVAATDQCPISEAFSRLALLLNQ